MVGLSNFHFLIFESFVRLIGPGEFKRVGYRSLTLLNASDHIGATDPMCLLVIGLRPPRRVIRMRMIETDDVLAAVPSLSLDANQFLGIDIVTIVSGVGSRVAATRRTVHNAGTAVFELTQQNATALVRIGLLTVLPDSFVICAFEFEHFGDLELLQVSSVPLCLLGELLLAPESLTQVFIPGVAQNRDNHSLLVPRGNLPRNL